MGKAISDSNREQPSRRARYATSWLKVLRLMPKQRRGFRTGLPQRSNAFYITAWKNSEIHSSL